MTQHEANLWWEKQGLAFYLWSPKEDMRERMILIAEIMKEETKTIVYYCFVSSKTL